jgi:4'-phosphopantetheinyl transferase EntD
MLLIERLEQTLRRRLSELTRQPIASACEPIDDCRGLLPEEAALVAAAVERRRSEFSAGRRCARRALASLGCHSQPVLMGRWRQPIWPRSFAGSISHDGRFAAALAYRSPSGRVWLSIDLIDRPDREIYREIDDVISHPADLPATTGDPLGIARLFSAKEAAIKIVSPHVGDFVDFRLLVARPTDNGFRVIVPGIGFEVAVSTFETDDVIVSLGLASDA